MHYPFTHPKTRKVKFKLWMNKVQNLCISQISYVNQAVYQPCIRVIYAFVTIRNIDNFLDFVGYLIFANTFFFQTFQRLNKLGICQSSDSWLRIMEDVGGNLGGIIGDLMSKGWQPRVVYDNFDFRITLGQLTKDHQNTDNHWISQFITFFF